MSIAAFSGFAQGFAGSRQAVQSRKDRRALTAALDRFSTAAASAPMSLGVAPPGQAGGPGGAGIGPIPSYDGKIGDRPQYAFNYFVRQGLPRHVAAGLVGNLMQESGAEINPAAVGDNGNAFGAPQLNGPRRHAYLAFAAERGVDPTDFDAQLDYLMHEGRTTEKSAWGRILAAKSAEEAALIGSRFFWRPGVPHNERRAAYANAVYRQYGAADLPRAMGVGPM